jgi:hypothetical protein
MNWIIDHWERVAGLMIIFAISKVAADLYFERYDKRKK